MMIGVDRLPNSLLAQTTLSLPGSQRSMVPVSREMPFCSGPRHIGQSSGSAVVDGSDVLAVAMATWTGSFFSTAEFASAAGFASATGFVSVAGVADLVA